MLLLSVAENILYSILFETTLFGQHQLPCYYFTCNDYVHKTNHASSFLPRICCHILLIQNNKLLIESALYIISVSDMGSSQCFCGNI